MWNPMNLTGAVKLAFEKWNKIADALALTVVLKADLLDLHAV